MSLADGIGNDRLLELFFSQSLDGFFFMMLDEPVEWNDHVDKDRVLDYVFEHQHMTKVNSAMVGMFRASSADDLIGATPSEFFAHDLVSAKERWRGLGVHQLRSISWLPNRTNPSKHRHLNHRS